MKVKQGFTLLTFVWQLGIYMLWSARRYGLDDPYVDVDAAVFSFSGGYYIGLMAAQRHSRCFADLGLTLRSLDASACIGAVQWLAADAFSNSYPHHAQPPQHPRSPQHSTHHQQP